MSKVVAIFEWPKSVESAFALTPASIKSEAKVWRLGELQAIRYRLSILVAFLVVLPIVAVILALVGLGSGDN